MVGSNKSSRRLEISSSHGEIWYVERKSVYLLDIIIASSSASQEVLVRWGKCFMLAQRLCAWNDSWRKWMRDYIHFLELLSLCIVFFFILVHSVEDQHLSRSSLSQALCPFTQLTVYLLGPVNTRSWQSA